MCNTSDQTTGDVLCQLMGLGDTAEVFETRTESNFDSNYTLSNIICESGVSNFHQCAKNENVENCGAERDSVAFLKCKPCNLPPMLSNLKYPENIFRVPNFPIKSDE